MKRLVLFAGMVYLFMSCAGSPGFTEGKGDMDWKLFRGDAALSGYTDTPLPEDPVLLWSYKGNTRTVSSPVVDKGTTYWCDKKGHIQGIDIKGNPAFSYDLNTAVEATPMIHDSILYIGRIDGFLSAVSLSKKDTLWNFETMGQVSATPNTVNFEGRQSVVFGSYDNFLYCVDARDGSEINRFESGYYLNGAVAVWKEHVIFGGCDSWLRIINTRTGMPTDSLLLDAYIPASPAIMGDFCYVGDYSGNIYELLLEKGKIVRHKKIMKSTNENSSFVSVLSITSETVYALSYERYLYSINRKDGKVNWKYLLKGNVGESSPLVCDDKVIVCTKTGIVTILDTQKGTLEWEYDTGEQIVGSPAVIKDHFFVLTTKGTLLCFGNK